MSKVNSVSKARTPLALIRRMIVDAKLAGSIAQREFDLYDNADDMRDAEHWAKTVEWLKGWLAFYSRPLP